MIFHGNNLIPEGLETGEFKIQNTTEIDDLEPAYVVAYSGDVIKSSESTNLKELDQSGYSYNGIYSSVVFIVCNDYGFNSLMGFLNLEDNSQHILSAFCVPKLAVKSLIPTEQEGQHTYSIEYLERNFKESAVIKTLNNRPNSIDGYTPRNKKLLTYPYLYLGFNPPNGTDKIFRFEDFSETPSFKIISEINPNPEIHFIPRNYRGKSGDNLNDEVTMNGYPTVSYKTDTFNSWLAQNSEIINLQMQQEQFNYEISAYKTGINGGSDILAKSFTNPIGALESGANLGFDLASLDKNHEFYIKNQMAQIEKQKMLPDKASLSGSNATLLGYNLNNKQIFTTYSIKRQFAERIDKFFDMYGYQTNTVKIPNITGRPNWNYIKLQGANIFANIPQEDLHQIKEFFNNGITLWHNPSNFLDYSVNNR